MRSPDEVKEMIHKIHTRILAMEDRLIIKEKCDRLETRVCIHTLNQEICLLRWVLEPKGH